MTFKCNDSDILEELGATLAPVLASTNTLLSVSCAFLYLSICIRLNRQFFNPENISTIHSNGVAELTKLKWRLTLIVLINTICWIPVTTIHWYLIFTKGSVVGRALFQNLTATNLILSPAINPLIYTIAGKQFIQFLNKCWKFLKCQVTVRCPKEPGYDDYLIGVKRCSCIPCVQCTRPPGLGHVGHRRSQSIFI